ncbi:MAG: hypothetical protein FWF79_08460 [Defluviitaleaceae bacterium]|nr:hypothetical protein [Defluviitaleaceae bacterium]
MVLYYSRGKKTKIFAEALGEIQDCNVFELESDLNKKGMVGFIVKALSLAFSAKSYPAKMPDMTDGLPDEIFLCGPVWGGQLVGPPRYFLENADLKNTTVHLLLTARVPVEKYKTDALEYLNKIPCKPGRAYIFATSGKMPPEKAVVTEQLRGMINE